MFHARRHRSIAGQRQAASPFLSPVIRSSSGTRSSAAGVRPRYSPSFGRSTQRWTKVTGPDHNAGDGPEAHVFLETLQSEIVRPAQGVLAVAPLDALERHDVVLHLTPTGVARPGRRLDPPAAPSPAPLSRGGGSCSATSCGDCRAPTRGGAVHGARGHAQAPGHPSTRGDRGQAAALWAMLLARIYEVFPLLFRRCGDAMTWIGFITDRGSIQRILEHPGEPTRPPPTPKLLPARADLTGVGSTRARAPDANPRAPHTHRGDPN